MILPLEGLDYNSDDVAILYSNRAACYLKIGDCRSCVTDCNTAIAMAPANSYKPLLRRALAYETMERSGKLHTSFCMQLIMKCAIWCYKLIFVSLKPSEVNVFWLV